MDKGYDILVVITPNDYKRVEWLLPRTMEGLPGRDVFFIGSSQLGEILPEEISVGLESRNSFTLRMGLLLQKRNWRQEPAPAVQGSGFLRGKGSCVPPTLGH